MNSLLKLATEAHGGVDRWNQLTELKAHLSVTGGIWHVKGRPDVLKDIRIELPLHEERLITHFVGQNKRFVFTPDQVSVEDEQGHPIENRDDPRCAFEGQSYETPWDDLHVAYFDSYALWTYLTIPFLYTYPGFVTEELPPWQEEGEEWRRLKAVFPENIAATRVNRSPTRPGWIVAPARVCCRHHGRSPRSQLRLRLSRSKRHQGAYDSQSRCIRRQQAQDSRSSSGCDRHP